MSHTCLSLVPVWAWGRTDGVSENAPSLSFFPGSIHFDPANFYWVSGMRQVDSEGKWMGMAVFHLRWRDQRTGAGLGNLRPPGRMWPTAWFCLAHKLRTVLTFTPVFLNQRRNYMSWHMKLIQNSDFNNHRWSIIGTRSCAFIYLLSVAAFPLRGRAKELCRRPSDQQSLHHLLLTEQ